MGCVEPGGGGITCRTLYRNLGAFVIILILIYLLTKNRHNLSHRTSAAYLGDQNLVIFNGIS
jgi:hypothetical protein